MISKLKPTNMKEEGKHVLVPKVRFPEFREAEGWEETTIGNQAILLKGKGVSKSDIDHSGEQPCIRYGELYTRYGETIETVFSRTKVPASELFLSKRNDVLIPASGETKIDIATASCVMRDDVAVGGDINVIRSGLNGTFLSYCLNGPQRLKIAKVAQGDTVVHLYPSQLRQILIAIPRPREQQKIGECLSSVDELIAAQDRELAALKTHKQGLMQQLFPREGETQPRLRFPEFRDAGEWEEKPIRELFRFKQGVQIPLEDQLHIQEPGTVRFIRIIDITQNGERYRYVKDQGSDHIVHSRELFMIRYGTPGTIAIGYEGVIANNLFRLIWINSGTYIPKYWFYVFKNLESVIYNLSCSSSMPAISFSILNAILTRITTPEEQQRIASCLTAIDDLITVQTQKLTALKTHKKGLMQQLFPSQ